MADTYFVSQLGTSASGAVSIVFSLMAIIQAVGFTLGMGAGSLISRLLGRQRRGAGHRHRLHLLLFGRGLRAAAERVWPALCGGAHAPLGATETILPYAADYARYILLGAPVMCASFVMNNILRSEGRAALSMIGLTAGGVLNIILDPISLSLYWIWAFPAQRLPRCSASASAFVCCLPVFFWAKASASCVSAAFPGTGRITWIFCAPVMPSLCRQGLASASTVALNVSASAYGDPAVAAMSIVGRIFMFVLSVMPASGRAFSRWRAITSVRGSIAGAAVLLVYRLARLWCDELLAAIGLFFAPQIISLFRAGDAEVIAIGSRWRCGCSAWWHRCIPG